MKKDFQPPTRIPASELSELKSWHLPEMLPLTDSPAFFAQPHPRHEEDAVFVTDEEVAAQTLSLEDIERIREEAYQEGFAQGREEGFAQGHIEGQAAGQSEALRLGEEQTQERLELLQAIAESFRQPLAQQEQALAKHLTELVLKISEAVVKTELAEHQALFQQTLESALAQLPKQTSPFTLRVHPHDVERLDWLAERYDYVVQEDLALAPGSCVLLNEWSHIEFDVEKRFAQVAEEFRQRYQLLYTDPHPNSGEA